MRERDPRKDYRGLLAVIFVFAVIGYGVANSPSDPAWSLNNEFRR
jgi:hypothetical protein